MEGGALGSGGGVAVEEGEELGSLGGLEIGLGFLLFGGELGLRRLTVEPEGEDAVPVAGPLVEGGDVAIHAEVAGTEREWLRGVRQQQGDHVGEAGGFRGLAAGQVAGGAVEGEVVTGGSGGVAGGEGELGEGVELGC